MKHDLKYLTGTAILSGIGLLLSSCTPFQAEKLIWKNVPNRNP